MKIFVKDTNNLNQHKKKNSKIAIILQEGVYRIHRIIFNISKSNLVVIFKG